MPPKKRKRSCPFSSAKTRPTKSKKSFDKELALKLVESGKGSLYKQEKWLEDYANDQKSKELLLFLQAGRSTIYEKRIIYCKQNDNYTYAYRDKYYLVSKSSVFELN